MEEREITVEELISEAATALRWAAWSGHSHVGFDSLPAAPRRSQATQSAQPAQPARPSQPPRRGEAPPSAQGSGVAEPARPNEPAAATSSAPATLTALGEQVSACTNCALHRDRQRVVLGAGASDAAMMVVVDGPTRGDEQAGRLLSGPAGELFDKMLGAMGLSRQQIYVTAMTRCTSGKPASEPPPKLAVQSCAPFLAHELALVKPKVVVIMGERASEKLLGKPLAKACGWWDKVGALDAIATWGPEALLADASRKRQTWEDLKEVMRRLKLTSR